MKKFFVCTVVFVTLFHINSLAQKPFMKYGKVSEQEMTMTEYAQDTSAGAVILGDYGVTRFSFSADNGFYQTFTRHVRLKILDKTELDWADFTIRLYESDSGEDEDLSMLRGQTFNMEDGKEVKYKLKNDAIFREEEDKNHKRIKFTMPNVKEGSVIDVTYTISSPFIFTLNPWYFQKSIPVQKSVYHVFIPEYFYYKNWTTGYVPISKETERRTESYQFSKGAEITSNGRESGGIYSIEADVTHWTYLASNVPAFLEEPYMTTVFDYLSAVEFELVSTDFPGSVKKFYTRSWKDINDDLIQDADFGKQLDNTGHLKDQIERISSVSSDPKTQMILAYEHIKNSIVWNNRYAVYPTESIRKAYTDGKGTTADINLNLIALLQGLNIDANPVLVSTRRNGKLKPGQVILTQFNHVVAGVTIDGESYVLDAIDHYCPAYILPPNTLNEKGMMVGKAGYKWIDLYSELPSMQVTFLNFTINDELEFTGNYKQTQENFAALAKRKEIKSLTNPEAYTEEMEKSIEGLEVENLVIENLDSIYKPLDINADVVLRDRITEGGDLLYFNPVLFSRLEENPFKNESRDFPVDFNYPIEMKFSALIQLPEGYQVEEMPESMSISLRDNGGKFQYGLKLNGNQLVVSYTYEINQTIFPSINYLEIKKFFEMMVSKQAEQVVLKRVI